MNRGTINARYLVAFAGLVPADKHTIVGLLKAGVSVVLIPG